MYNQLYNQQRRRGVCIKNPYNFGLECYVKKCATCGWNPEVMKQRIKARRLKNDN